MVDYLVLLGLIVTSVYVIDAAGLNGAGPRFIAIGVLLLYDPLLITVFGATIGHKILGIKVKRVRNIEQNIVFPLAMVRFIFKTTFGWLSLLTINLNIKNQAVHDFLSGSVVVYK